MKILEKNGLRYVDEGQGEVIIFFHGWGVSPYACQDLINALAVNHRVIAPFFRSFINFKEDEKIIKDLVKEARDVIVIGHSAGGISAVSFSLYIQDKIKTLILIDSLGAVVNKTMFKWSMMWLKESLHIFFHPNSLSKVLVRDFFYQARTPLRLLRDSHYIINKDIKLTHEFPVLILWGKEDKLIPIENGHNLKKSIKGAKLKVVGGDHYWFLEKPEIFTEEMNKFLKSI